MEYEPWGRGVSSHVNIWQDIQKMTLSAGGEAQPAKQNGVISTL
jgi:hypothetical protein